jgi:hypothetical protein
MTPLKFGNSDGFSLSSCGVSVTQWTTGGTSLFIGISCVMLREVSLRIEIPSRVGG